MCIGFAGYGLLPVEAYVREISPYKLTLLSPFSSATPQFTSDRYSR